MKIDGGLLRLSATDLGKHLGCRHLTELDRQVAEGTRAFPNWHDPALAPLQKRGLAHEEAYVAHLQAQGRRILSLRDMDGETARERAVQAMREGVEVIVQADLGNERWSGRADLLVKVPRPSKLGEWSYEVEDTKLAQDTRGGTVLQLCLYSELVADVQGTVPNQMHVVKPGEGFPRDSFRFAEYQAYYRLIKTRLEGAVAAPTAQTYPTPVPQCDFCSWWKECDERRHEDDHLCLVAGAGSLHVTELQRQGITTLENFAERTEPLADRPERGSREAFAKLHGQARIQLAGRRQRTPVYELLPPEAERGFLRLPAPDAGDVFFDIEADAFVEGGGLEYLLGLACRDEKGELRYRALWALDRDEERQAFETFIDFVAERWKNYPCMHIYHYAPYEPAAVKRLMGRYGAREAEVDRLLRGKRFVDLYAVTRQGLRASVERYSLKPLEEFFGYERAIELPEASAALRRVNCALELGEPPEVTSEDRVAVESYNRDDCLATEALQRWLEERRSELEERGHAVPRPPLLEGDASEAVEERDERTREVYEALLAQLSEDREAWGPNENATWLLAHQLDYFRRELNCAYWEFFRIHELDDEELLEERKAVAGLEFVGEIEGGTAIRPIHRYGFPTQEAALDPDDAVHEVGGESVGTVAAIHPAEGWLDIRKSGKTHEIHPRAVLVKEVVTPSPLDTSLLSLGRWVGEHGVDGVGSFRAARDLLLRRRPRLQGGESGALRQPGETAVEAGVRLVQELDCGVLPIQGPPGTGKTFTGARMILALAQAGKRVGVTAVSHKVIRNLLEKTLEAADKADVSIEVVHKPKKREGNCPDGFEEVTDNDKALAALDEAKVVGGTAWLWARDDAVEKLDYLVVDEAGQMSLAHVLAAARAAKNLVLLGDPQQLEQPQKGAHPEGAEVAALVHVLAGRETIANDMGLFLDVTWRLCPAIGAFTSELYYEKRLLTREGLERQVLVGPTPFAGSGLFYVPVVHAGNQNRSLEEVEAVARVVESLLRGGITWTDGEGQVQPLAAKGILVVAPYNAQVGALSQRLPGLNVGTVDKFQGQQAPVVIYSTASSSAEDAPRGMGFLYNPNRLNVATSRAQCVCILVAAPRVFEPECRTPEQMRWANGLCRYRELATEVAV
jgi:uncharacterized protein